MDAMMAGTPSEIGGRSMKEKFGRAIVGISSMPVGRGAMHGEKTRELGVGHDVLFGAAT
ncbi:hypothetical protein [Streptosporangium longisporum]|uniref:hypothetical protein n=1 Tax=Streptosporangium longisporum TaxID=46187 RepID=UPI0031EE6098